MAFFIFLCYSSGQNAILPRFMVPTAFHSNQDAVPDAMNCRWIFADVSLYYSFCTVFGGFICFLTNSPSVFIKFLIISEGWMTRGPFLLFFNWTTTVRVNKAIVLSTKLRTEFDSIILRVRRR